MTSFRRMWAGSDVRLNRLFTIIETKLRATIAPIVPTTPETLVLTGIASISVVVISVIVFDLRNPFSLIGVVLKSLPYVVTWRESRGYTDHKKLPLYLAGGLAAYFPVDAYVSFISIHQAESSTAPIAAFMVMATSFVIIPAGAFITFVLMRIAGSAIKLFR